MNNTIFILGVGAFFLMMIGLYGVLTNRNVFRLILGLGLMETGVNLFIVGASYWKGGKPPILGTVFETKAVDSYADPVPQALVLTSIVIGLGVTALALALMVRLKETTKSIDIIETKEEEVNE